MGVQFGSTIKGKEIELKDLKGKIIAIDSFNYLYQFLSIIRDRTTGEPLRDSHGNITSHLSGLFYRTAKLMEAGVKPIYVFDGKPPEFKAGTAQIRREAREEAHHKWKEALERGESKEALKQAKMSTRLSTESIESAKELLKYMGVPIIQAPSEAEAQCAYMCAKKQVWSSASQDWDSILFGSTRLIRNLSITGRRKLPGKNAYYELKPELVESKEIFDHYGVDRKQMIMVAMLIGTDFNPGVKGYGPKRSIELVKKEKTLKNVIGKVEWSGPEPEKVFDFFMNPPSVDAEIKSKDLDPDKIREFMIEKHEFSRDRIEKVIETLTKVRPSTSSLGKWLK